MPKKGCTGKRAGLKKAAKKIAEKAGVPMDSGYAMAQAAKNKAKMRRGPTKT